MFEGIDASGKSTQVAYVAGMLESMGKAVHVTAEPTTGPIGTLIRQAFSGRVAMDDRTIAALFVADRIDHLTNSVDGILDLLSQGTTVISDRYYLSSLAYHSDDIDMDWVLRANELSTQLLRPDLTIYLDLKPEDALDRLRVRRTASDKFEVLERLASAHRNYARAIDLLQPDEDVHIVSALGSPSDVRERVRAIVDSAFVPVEGNQ